MPLTQREIDKVIGRDSDGFSVKAIVGAALTALLIGFGGYVVGGVTKADEAKTANEVFKAEVQGQLALIRADQERLRGDVMDIKAMLKR